MDDLKVGDLIIRVDRSAPDCLRLDWMGRSDDGNPGQFIGPFFEKALAEAQGGGRAIDMHFEALSYFNSSCIATLVRIVRQAREAKVVLRLYYDSELKWQSLTFDVLERALSSMVGRRTGPEVEFHPVRA